MPASPLRLAVVSEHDLVLGGVRQLLEPFAERLVIVESDCAVPPDVLLYDVIGLHSGDGQDLEDAVKRSPGRVLALSRDLQPGLTARALALGAIASVSMGASAVDLLTTVECVATGALQDGSQPDLDNQAARRRQLGRDLDLGRRERQVLGLIVQGRSNQEIATDLYLSINTVKTLIRSAYAKIGVTSRSQAVAWGVEHGFPLVGASE